jgi:hypothetical protein
MPARRGDRACCAFVAVARVHNAWRRQHAYVGGVRAVMQRMTLRAIYAPVIAAWRRRRGAARAGEGK